MKKMMAALLCAMACAGMSAQDKYCYTYADYKSGKWEELDTIVVSERSVSWRYWAGDADYKVKTGSKSFDRLLDKKVRIVMLRDSSLYVNCRGLKVEGHSFGNGFARGYHYGDKILFEAKRNDDEGVDQQDKGGYLGAVIGQVDRSCYVLDSDDKKVVRIDEPYMEKLLRDYPGELRKYRFEDKSEREKSYLVIRILKKIGLIK